MSLLPLMTTLSIAAATWEELPPLPAAVGGALCGIHHSKVVVIGGTNWHGETKNWLDTVHVYDPSIRQWQTLKDAMPSPVAYGVEMQQGPQFTFVGGSSGKGVLRSLGSFDGAVVKFENVAALPPSVVLSAGGIIDGQMILLGGTDDAANLAGLTRATLVVENGHVKNLADHPGKPLAVAASAVIGGELFVFGGMNYDASTQKPVNTAEAYAFSPAKNEWRNLKPLKSANRGVKAVALDDRHIYLAGGFTDGFTAEAVIYDAKTDSYQTAPPLPYAGMVSLVASDGYLYCVGGEDKMKSRTNQFFRIRIEYLLK